MSEAQFASGAAERVWANPRFPNLLLLTGSNRMTLHDLNQPGATRTCAIPENAGVSWIAWHPDGKLIAIAGERIRRLYVCSAATGAIAAIMDGHTTNGILVWFDPAGDRLWSADWSGQLRLWDWQAGRQTLDVSAPITIPPVVAADGTLAAAVRDNHVQLLRVAVGREVSRLSISAEVPVDRSGLSGPAIVSPDGRLLAAPYEDQLALFDLPSRMLIDTVPFRQAMPIQFASDNSALWLSHKSGLLRLYRISLGRRGNVLRVGRPQAVVSSAEYGSDRYGMSDDAQVLAVPNRDGGTLLFRDLKKPPTRLGPQHDVRFCSVSPDGKWVISGGHSEPCSIALWSVATGAKVKVLETWGGHSAFSRDGHWACTWRNDTRKVHLWDTSTWQSRAEFSGQCAVFSPDARFVAVDGDAGVVRLLRVPDGKEVVQLSVPDNVRFFPTSFSPDGGTLAALSFGLGYVLTWDLHAIRRQLRAIALDWDDAAIPEPPPGPFHYPKPLIAPNPVPVAPTTPASVTRVADSGVQWAALSVLIALQPLQPMSYLRRAECLLALDRLDEAARDVDQALQLNPELVLGRLLRGRIRRRQGSLAEALDDFDWAARMAPADSSVHVERANTALLLHDDRVFQQSARRLTELLPTDSSWWHWYSISLLVAEPPLRDVPAALVATGKAVRLAPRNPFLHTVFAYALLENGRVVDAAREFDKSQQMRPRTPFDLANQFGLTLCAFAQETWTWLALVSSKATTRKSRPGSPTFSRRDCLRKCKPRRPRN